jgi:3-oxoacyl-[acyl-carrier protein] reductase
MDLELEGNAALVVASSSGLGKATARSLLGEGANVVINGRDEERLAEAKADLEADAEGRVVAQPGDLTDPDDIEALVRRTVDEFGGVDHIVTSTGGPPRLRFPEAEDDDWYHAFDLLVMSVVRLVREASPHLEADGGGSVVMITSRSVKEPSPANVLSGSVRTAVTGLGKILSRELAPEVRVNSVMPRSIETARVTAAWDAAIERGEIDSYEEGRAARAETAPLDRVGDPAELGDLVATLLSPRAGYTTGEAILVDGGMTKSVL